MVFIYASPLSNNQSRLKYWADYYIYPFFHQGWNLFAPPPTDNYKLFVSYEDQGMRKQEIISQVMSTHQEHRFKGYEALVLGLTNSVFYFEKNSPMQKQLNGPVKHDLNFDIIEYEVRHYLQWKNKIKLTQLQLIVYTNNVKTKQQKVYFN